MAGSGPRLSVRCTLSGMVEDSFLAIVWTLISTLDRSVVCSSSLRVVPRCSRHEHHALLKELALPHSARL